VDPCQQFICGWLADNSPLPEWMRPDKANLILLASNFQWRGVPVHVAVAVGARPKEKAINWLKEFCRQSQRPLIFQTDGEWIAYGPPRFQGFPNYLLPGFRTALSKNSWSDAMQSRSR
jgi:hypothetical protein